MVSGGNSVCSYRVEEGGIAVMEINNPPMNALSIPVLRAMRQAINEALADETVRVIVFTGAGKAFIAGADINEIEKLHAAQAGSDYLKTGQDLFNLIENSNKPFIAAINVFCSEVGLSAAGCHIRLRMRRRCWACLKKLGIYTGYAGTQRTPA
jgi:enoyl-CoA hydratase/carnithine racemase